MQNQSSLAGNPFSLLSSLILHSVKGLAIPGSVLRLRNYAMVLTFGALAVSTWESFRYVMQLGPLPENDT